jgi:hypothetical protein
MMRHLVGATAFALMLSISSSIAQQAQTVRVRGTIEVVDGPTLTIKSRDGQTTYKVKLADNWSCATS